jgi:ATP-dependent DNA helicase RecG
LKKCFDHLESTVYIIYVYGVWVGIQDPDPTVACKGIGYLIRQGVTVHMFDRDLQEVIEKENKEFLEQATERAAEIEEEPGKVALSPLENRLPTAELEDFSDDALETYRQRAKIADAVGSDAFNRRLLRQGLLKED